MEANGGILCPREVVLVVQEAESGYIGQWPINMGIVGIVVELPISHQIPNICKILHGVVRMGEDLLYCATCGEVEQFGVGEEVGKYHLACVTVAC